MTRRIRRTGHSVGVGLFGSVWLPLLPSLTTSFWTRHAAKPLKDAAPKGN